MIDPLALFLNFLLFSLRSPFCSHTTISCTLINPDSFQAKETARTDISFKSQYDWQCWSTHTSAKTAAQKCLLRPSNLTPTLALSGVSSHSIVILVLITNREIVLFDCFIICLSFPSRISAVSAGIFDFLYFCMLSASPV